MALDPTVVLLVGADTAVVDESQYGKALTLVGNAARTTAQAKFGAGSITFDGAGDFVTAADSPDWHFGAGDLTVEGWFRLARNTDQALVGQWDNSGSLNNASWFLYVVGTTIYFRMVWGFSITDVVGSGAAPLTINRWYHIAATRAGTTARLFLDGVQIGITTGITQTLNDSSTALSIGRIGTATTYASYDYAGQIDELRITKGLARYTANFTPPTGPFPRPTPDVTVPNVVGLSQAAATTALLAADLVVGTVTPVPSTAVAPGAVVTQSPAAGAVVAPGSAVNLTIAFIPGFAVTINGTVQRILHESLSIQATVNGRDRCSATLPLPTVAPEVRQEIVVTDDGVHIFGGLIDTATMKAGSSWTDRDDQLHYEITAADFNTLADWRLVNGPRPEETLKDYLTDLVPFLPGVTLDPAQVDGPLLPSRNQVFRTVTQVLDEAATITGYVWNIDYHRVLSMWLPSSAPAPFDILDSNTHAIGDITVEPIATGYATSIWLLAGDNSQQGIFDSYTGDGTRTVFSVRHRLVTHGGTLSNNGVTETVGPGLTWELHPWMAEPLVYTLHKMTGPPPVAGAEIIFPYTAQFPLVFHKVDAAAEAALGYIVEQLFTEPTVFDPQQAEALADGYLAQVTQETVEIRYATLRGDIQPGQTQTITIATRDLSGSFVITDVETRMQDPLLIRHVTARQPGPYAGNWRDVYKLWAQGAQAAGTAPGSGVVPPTPGGGGGAPDAHHATHEPGGTDALTNLSASILTSGTLPDARLSANVALENVANTFTQNQTIQRDYANLVLIHPSTPANQRRWQLVTDGLEYQLQTATDLGAFVGVPFRADRSNQVYLGQDVFEKGRTTALGHWQDVPYNVTNFSAVAPMTWTVEAADVQVNRYTLIGKTLIWMVYLVATTLAGSASNQLVLALPAGLAARPKGGASATAQLYDGANRRGMALVDDGGANILIQQDPVANFTLNTNGTYLIFQVSVEIL